MDYTELKAALDRYFSDRSRSAEETRQGLVDLRDELDMLIDSLPEGET
jgi:hypothetical protein